MRKDKLLGPFVPVELDKAGHSLRLLIAYLFHEMERNSQARDVRVDLFEKIRMAVVSRLSDQAGTREAAE